SALSAQRLAPRTRARDAALARSIRDAALRRAGATRERGAAWDGALRPRGVAARGRDALRRGRPRGDALRRPVGEGRGGGRRLGGRRDRPAGLARAEAALSGAGPADRRL